MEIDPLRRLKFMEYDIKEIFADDALESTHINDDEGNRRVKEVVINILEKLQDYICELENIRDKEKING